MDGTDNELSEDQMERYHHILAKLSYVVTRVRPDIDLEISSYAHE